MSDLVPADITARIERMATDPNGVVQYDARTTRMLEQSMDEFRNGLAMNPDAIRVRHAYTLGRINGILTKRILDEDQVGLIPLWMRVRSEEASLHGTDAKKESDGIQFIINTALPPEPVDTVDAEFREIADA